tara:strand:+ start:2895 stop:3038 length:144 start_codon:yes stop_codon:yes gene_type:complete
LLGEHFLPIERSKLCPHGPKHLCFQSAAIGFPQGIDLSSVLGDSILI